MIIFFLLKELSLKVLYRMFAAHTAHTTREAYLCLTEQLNEFFMSEEGSVNTLSMGIDPADERYLRVLRWVYTIIIVVYFSGENKRILCNH